MRIEKKILKPGVRVRLLENVDMFDCVYTKGHEFNVVSETCRGVDLEDDQGYRIEECLFIHNLLEVI